MALLPDLPLPEDLERAHDLVAKLSPDAPFIILAETSSTNDEAKRGAAGGAPHGATWVADVQSSGRGRQGRTWLARAGENVLLSMVVRVVCPLARVPSLALAAGLAARDAVAKAAPSADVRMKWPNDVVVGAERKKVAGVLVESTVTRGRIDALIVGVGINVHGRDFPDAIRDRAVSVAELTEAPPDRAVILASLVEGLLRDIPAVAGRGLEAVRARLTAADALYGERVVSEDRRGTAEGIASDGRLLVRRDDGILEHWSSGEVHLLLS